MHNRSLEASANNRENVRSTVFVAESKPLKRIRDQWVFKLVVTIDEAGERWVLTTYDHNYALRNQPLEAFGRINGRRDVET